MAAEEKIKTECMGKKMNKKGKGKRRNKIWLKNASLRVKNSKIQPSRRFDGPRGKNDVLKVGGGEKKYRNV